MVEPRILVTGATGKTGGAVVNELLQRGVAVRAVVRREDARSERLRRAGAETVIADLYDPDQLLEAMKDVQRAYYLGPIQPYMIQSAAAFASAAREAKLEQIVHLSQWLASPAHPSLMTRQTWLADSVLSMTPGIAYTIVNPGYFAWNYLVAIGFAAHLGIMPNFVGDSRNAPPSEQDIARVVAAVLLDPARHDGRRYRPTGPKLLDANEIAEIVGRAVNRKVYSVPMPFWLFSKTARMMGVGAYDILSLRIYFEDHKQGAFERGAPTNDVLEVTGQPAEDFEVTARRYAALPEAQRSRGATTKAVFDFLRTPFMPGHDVARLERELRSPVPPKPRFAMEDDAWKATHSDVSSAVAHSWRPGPDHSQPALFQRNDGPRRLSQQADNLRGAQA